MKMRLWHTLTLALGFAAAAWGQQNAAPPLAETMQFIQTTLNAQGKMNWTTNYHDSADNTNWNYVFNFEANKVVADAAACTISYHYIIIRDGAKISDSDATFSLHDVQDVMLTTGDARQNKNDVAAGHPTWTAKVDPPVFDLIVREKEKAEFYFFFYDEDTANRAAKALGHAVELCGGSRGSF